MAIIKETRTITETKEVKVARVCDLCGRKSLNPYDDNWGDQCDYVVNRVTIQHERGTCYPESANLEAFKPDVCPDCFEEKVLPALRAIGLIGSYEDTSW